MALKTLWKMFLNMILFNSGGRKKGKDKMSQGPTEDS